MADKMPVKKSEDAIKEAEADLRKLKRKLKKQVADGATKGQMAYTKGRITICKKWIEDLKFIPIFVKAMRRA